ncbi:hypothetical protein GW924_01525 [Candidatus Pacearchaeota archaeon]|nr:hypothetical protein [Candidatus Pacearchaeota archaeon]OIO43884.1 MAG: hypothetical protein AUJ64_01130 [Candidatus Pacearchaeota archaeon CG1_02_39_14]
MRSIDEIVEEKVERRFNSILKTIDEGSELEDVSLNEILNVAGKLKRTDLINLGEMPKIERDAEIKYRKALSTLSTDVAEEYVKIKDSNNPARLSSLNLPIDDKQFKLNYIEDKIAYNPEMDRSYLVEAIRTIAERKEQIELKKIRGLHKSVSRKSEFGDFFNLYSEISQDASAVLFDRSLQKNLILACDGNNLEVLVYKCLRLTHDAGIPNICSHLDDYVTQDKDGKDIKFLGEPDKYQLDRTRELSQMVSSRIQNLSLIMLISDFDLWKFGSETVTRLLPKAKDYIKHVKGYLPEIKVISETDYVKSFPDFDSNFNRVFESIRNRDGRFIHPAEFSRIETDYNNTFAGTLNEWTEEKNLHYSLSSVSRNIATGITLDEARGNFLFVFYNNNTINGERINLNVRDKIPCLAYPKMKSKQIL